VTDPRQPPAARQRRLTDRMMLNISEPVHARLTAIQARLQAARGRRVSYSEVLEQLLELWDQKGPKP
jgi:hypothetical protein